MPASPPSPTSDLGAVFLQHREAMLRAARKIVKRSEEAQDVVQDTYLRLSGRLGQWNGSGSLVAWLCTVARRLALDRLRGRGRSVSGELSVHPARSADAAEALVRAEEKERLRRAVDALPEGQRETVQLRFYAGLRLDEIAAKRGVAVGTVKATLHVALAKLRRELLPPT